MPTYDYCCSRCQIQFEARHGIAEEPPVCPHCAASVSRVFLSAPAVHGYMARGREAAARTLEPAPTGHGPGCPCCH